MKTCLPIVCLMLLSGCGAAADEAKKPDPVALVRTATAQLGTGSEQITVYGAAEAVPGGTHTLIAPAEAIISRIMAPDGTRVAAGQPVALLRPSRTTATDIARAANDATSSDAAYQRALRLRKDGLVSDADVETARAAAATARATRANSGMAGGGLVLRAPVAGTVEGFAGKEGDQVVSGTAVASVAATGDLRARFGVDPALAQRARAGQRIAIDTLAGGRHAVIEVVGVDRQVDQATRLASVYARIPAGLGVGPGEPLRGALAVGTGTSGISIPYAALLDDGGRSYVFVVKGGIATAVDVSPGDSTGDTVTILKGLNAGDVVVTQGGTGLEDGMHVRTGPLPDAQ